MGLLAYGLVPLPVAAGRNALMKKLAVGNHVIASCVARVTLIARKWRRILGAVGLTEAKTARR
jgi:hypothetical protein